MPVHGADKMQDESSVYMPLAATITQLRVGRRAAPIRGLHTKYAINN